MASISTREQLEKFFDAVKVPSTLTEKHIQICRSYAMNRLTDRLPIADWCTAESISSKSFYKWKAEQPNFEKYFLQLIDSAGSDDLEDAFARIDKKMIQLSEKETMSVQELRLFTDWFAGQMEVRKKKVLMASGLEDDGKSVSVEERRNSLLAKLQGGSK